MDTNHVNEENIETIDINIEGKLNFNNIKEGIVNFVNEHNELVKIFTKINDYILHKFPKELQDKVNALGNNIKIVVDEYQDYNIEDSTVDFDLDFNVFADSVKIGELHCEQVDVWKHYIFYKSGKISSPKFCYESCNFDEILNNKEFINFISKNV